MRNLVRRIQELEKAHARYLVVAMEDANRALKDQKMPIIEVLIEAQEAQQAGRKLTKAQSAACKQYFADLERYYPRSFSLLRNRTQLPFDPSGALAILLARRYTPEELDMALTIAKTKGPVEASKFLDENWAERRPLVPETAQANPPAGGQDRTGGLS